MLRRTALLLGLVGCLLLGVGGNAAAAAPQATLLPSGRAVAPPSAPPAVRSMIERANGSRHRPHRSGAAPPHRGPPGPCGGGGAHRDWRSRRYDGSGSVSCVMQAAGLLDWPLDSTGFMRWGGGGAGSWERIYANHEHVFAVIAGLRWDTSMTDDDDRSGPGWSEYMRSGGGFRLRHPLGLLQAVPLS